MTYKKALLWTAFWVTMAALFNVGIYYYMGSQKALEFFTGYVIELSLSMDNVFLFLMIFTLFCVRPEHQRRALNYGIIGAFVMRFIFILLGVKIIERFEWVLYIFGGLLLITSLKIIFGKDEEVHPEDNKIVQLFKRFFPVTNSFHGEKFFVRINGILHATPLFVTVIVIESSDLLFAIDSIPAIFAVTTDPFIIYSSNILAIMGLRALYFFIERVQQAFIFIKQGVGVILFITGIKMLLLIFHIKVPIAVALTLIISVLATSIIASLIYGKKHPEKLLDMTDCPLPEAMGETEGGKSSENIR